MTVRPAVLIGPLLATALAVPTIAAGSAGAAPAAGDPAASSSAAAGALASAAPAAEHKQAVATGTGGAVASETLGASAAGLSVLKSGGNAIDAAVATAATLGVDDPFVAGPGGGGFMVIYLAKTKQIVTIDGRETCPATCTPRYFLDASGTPLPFELARHSGISVGVPGMVAQWAKATNLYGRHSFAANLQPAIHLADHGFRISQNFHDTTLEALPDLQAFTPSRRLWLTPQGRPLPVGSFFRNPDLAKTYRQLARGGASYLYGGPLGSLIARTAQHPPVSAKAPAGFTVLPGSMTAADVKAYDAKSRPPTHVTYRGLDVYSMAPPSSGGTTVGEALNILSGWPLAKEPRAEALFHYLEASRLAFADRNAYVGDSDYVPVPISGLLDPAYAATRRCLVHGTALASPVAPGSPFAPYGGCGATTAAVPAQREGTSTNHLVTADRWGNIVSYTNTIEQLAGSGITVPGQGFLLNNELTDFDFAPATPATYDPNLPAPGKRPRSSMSPTIVLRGGTPWLAVGSPGGSTIITTVLQTLINRIDFGMTLPQAIAAPRASQRNNDPGQAEPAFAAQPYYQTLTHKYGEKLAVSPAPNDVIGFVNALEYLRPGVIEAATEPSRLGGGSALVVNPR